MGEFRNWWRRRPWWIRYAICAVVLIAVFYAVENTRGYLAWETYRKDAEARGERFDIEDFFATGISDEENFDASPFFELACRNAGNDFPVKLADLPEFDPFLESDQDYRGIKMCQSLPLDALFSGAPDLSREEAAERILELLSRWGPVIQQCAEAIDRPNRAPLELPERPFLFANSFVPATPFVETADALKFRSLAFLALDRFDEALSDVQMGLRLARKLAQGHTRMEVTIGYAIFLRLRPVIWEGLEGRKWSREQLETLREELNLIQPVEVISRMIRAEDRIGAVVLLDHLAASPVNRYRINRKWEFVDYATNLLEAGLPTELKPVPGAFDSSVFALMPGGWQRQNMTRLCRIVDLELAAVREFDPIRREVLCDEIENAQSGFWWPPSGMMELFSYGIVDYVEGNWRVECLLSIARVAVALEIYRIDRSRYPSSLGAMVPGYLDSAPIDPYSGAPLRYHRKADGTPRMYSFGLNRSDDGGTPHQDSEAGDIVWQYTLPEGFTLEDSKVSGALRRERVRANR